MTAVNTAETFADATVNTGIGIKARTTPKLIRALALEAKPLKSPNRSKSPQISESIARIMVNTRASCPATK